MQDYQQQFLDFVIGAGILRFGEFTLKSGRRSPYFFNAGLFNSGRSLGFIGRCYAAAVAERAPAFDVLFGPAYKGIPLASAASIALWNQYQQDKPYCFNRKEAKDHGEGGSLVGAPLQGRVLVVDDVITAGTAIREVMQLIQEAGARAAAVLVALDRQEKGRGELSAIQEIERDYDVPVISIINLRQIIRYLEQRDDAEFRRHLPKLKEYQESYGTE